MKNRTPPPIADRPPLPDFAPVPRKCERHDGWTPARQKAFVAALADTGCVKVAARMVNMAHASAYALRREPGAEGFRRAWEAALDFGLQILKDEAFDRALNGQLVPVFVAGKLMGFSRKKNDRLLMFCLRHYGQDAGGRRTTINYFSTRATAGHAGGMAQAELSSAGAASLGPPRLEEGDQAKLGGGGWKLGGEAPEPRALAAAEASTTTVRTVITGAGDSALSKLDLDDERAALLNDFEPAILDAQAQAEIHAALEAAATRRRALDPDRQSHANGRFKVQAADPDSHFIPIAPGAAPFAGELESGVELSEFIPFVEGEHPWESIGEPVPEWYVEWEKEQAQKQAALPPPEPPRPKPPRPEASPSHEEARVEAPASPRTGEPRHPQRKREPRPRIGPSPRPQPD